MKLLVVGGGPAGLASAALLAEAFPRAEIELIERRSPEQSHGFGITLRDHALRMLDLHTLLPSRPLTGRRVLWGGECVLALSAPATDTLVLPLARDDLVRALRQRCVERGVHLRWNTTWNISDDDALRRYDLVVAADGAHSALRTQRAGHFGVTVTLGRNHFAWFRVPTHFPEMTILLEDGELPCLAWAYQYGPDASSLIVELGEVGLRKLNRAGDSRELLRRNLHIDAEPKADGPGLCWQRFPTVRCGALHAGNVVLVGDAAHTMHFSQGFGTMFAFDDALALTLALQEADSLGQALARYDATQRAKIAELQAVASVSQRWSEDLVLALEASQHGRVAQLIESRWPGNTLGPAPMSWVASRGTAATC